MLPQDARGALAGVAGKFMKRERRSGQARVGDKSGRLPTKRPARLFAGELKGRPSSKCGRISAVEVSKPPGREGEPGTKAGLWARRRERVNRAIAHTLNIVCCVLYFKLENRPVITAMTSIASRLFINDHQGRSASQSRRRSLCRTSEFGQSV